jgi:arginyl-tRNA synthetase
VIEDQLRAWLGDGLRTAAPGLGLDGDLPEPELQEPRQKDHGDFATNVALAWPSAPACRRAGGRGVGGRPAPAPFVEKVEVAGPGFINVWTTDDWLLDTVGPSPPRARGSATRQPPRAHPGGVREREPDGPVARRPRAQRRPR